MTEDPRYEKDPAIRTVRALIQCFLGDHVEGMFRLTQVYEALNAKDAAEKTAVRKGISRERQAGNIVSTGTYGVWRKVESDVEWYGMGDEVSDLPPPLNIMLPLGLESMVKLYPGDLVCFAGLTSSGKSSASLEIALKNNSGLALNYLSSELTLAAIQQRAELVDIMLSSLKHVRFAMRYDHFEDVIEPGAINFVDYLQPSGDGDEPKYYSIPHMIMKIHKKLNGSGLVILNIQKDPGKESGEGGFKTMHKANLYITMDKAENSSKFWMNNKKCKVRPSLEGYRMQYKPEPFGLKSCSDWIPL